MAKHLSRIEVGKSCPSLETLDKISKVLKVEIKDFFELSHQGKSRREIDKTITALLKEASPDILPIIGKLVRAIIR